MHNIVIVEDQAVIRDSLKLLIESHKQAKVVDSFSNGKTFLDALDTLSEEIVLMDINMPVMDGVEAAKEALKLRPALKILALSAHGDETNYYKMVDAGVKGFVIKGADTDEINLAINTVAEGGSWFSPDLLRTVAGGLKDNQTDNKSLTEKELQLLHFLSEGFSDNEIAEEFKETPEKVRKQRNALLAKTKCTNAASLVMYAIKNQIIKV